MADIVDEVNDRLLSMPQPPQTRATHDYTMVYKGPDGAFVTETKADVRLGECFEYLEEDRMVDLLHDAWAFGYKADDGNLVIKYHHPDAKAELTKLLTS